MYALKNTLHFKWKISIHIFNEVVKLKHTHTHLISKALGWLYSNWMFVVVLRHYILFSNDRCQIYITSAISHSDQHYCFTAIQCHLLNFAPFTLKRSPTQNFHISLRKMLKNHAMWKYCQGAFIWMVTPRISLTDSVSSELVKFVCEVTENFSRHLAKNRKSKMVRACSG